MSETLTQFGTSFQSKILASLMGDVKFIQTISDILNPSMFDSDSNKWLVKSCLLYTSPSPRDGLLSRMPSSA